MPATYFFYDLETSGIHASQARIMQFAGIRTDEQLNPIGEPINVLVKLAPDVLPDPDAIMITGITPQQSLQDGLTEAEFLTYFYDEVVRPQTTFLGFNTVRFDDEFMRYLHYRNFYDPYEWQWYNDCSRWDILDLVRMTRALRPEGINWPVKDDGTPTNRLELLTKINGLEHEHAHDALSDVYATIAVAKLIRTKQPELFDYLFKCRAKKVVSELVLTGQPFVYTSGKYPTRFLHTSAAVLLAPHPQDGCGLVYDLRHDPTPYVSMTAEQLADAWRYNQDKTEPRLPVKTLKYNRCPAVAPLGVIKQAETQARIGLTLDIIQTNYAKLKNIQPQLAPLVLAALKILDAERQDYQQTSASSRSVDDQLYDGFLAPGDKAWLPRVRSTNPVELSSLISKLSDSRLKQLLPLYKARNYPAQLSAEERADWDAHTAEALFAGGQGSRLAQYFRKLDELAKQADLSTNQKYLVEELRLYGQSIVPSDGGDD